MFARTQHLQKTPLLLYHSPVKRIIDVIGSALGLIITLPLMAVIGLIVRLETPGPVLFHQVRTGRWGEEFVIFKFRTMLQSAEFRSNADGSARVTEDDDRITRFGRILRERGFDELPQLWNVLKGDMSLVGPRPCVPMQTSMLSERDRHRLDMRPGLVCLAEVSGRNLLQWSRRLDLDVYYVESWSLWLDFVIMLRTIPVVVFRRGVYSPAKPASSSQTPEVSETIKTDRN